MPDLRFCPKCGHQTAAECGGGFIEVGEYDGNKYEHEGNVIVYKCSIASCQYAHYSQD